jgi:hypothetical protein
MNSCKVLFLTMFFGCCSLVSYSQTYSNGVIVGPAGDCGLTYFYNASGDRFLRVNVICTSLPGSGGGGGSSGKKEEDSTYAQADIFLISPNPTSGPFVLTSSTELSNAHLIITDDNSKTMLSQTLNGKVFPIDISGFVPGQYHLLITTSQKTSSKTVIKM